MIGASVDRERIRRLGRLLRCAGREFYTTSESSGWGWEICNLPAAGYSTGPRIMGDGNLEPERRQGDGPTPAPISVSVIIPAFNEEAGIAEVLGATRKQQVPGYRFEIILVDDGSSDRTPILLQQYRDLCDKLVTHARNSGKRAAVISGLQVATGDYILFQDADLEYSPLEYVDLLHPITAFGAEIVLGSRFLAP
jgi:hypothetical protein